MLNKELISNILEKLTLYPEQHKQEDYMVKINNVCCYCIAGWTIFFAGNKEQNKLLQENKHTIFDELYDIGKDLLELSEDQADVLFHFSQTQEDVLELIDSFLK
jgi:hypothetical protein